MTLSKIDLIKIETLLDKQEQKFEDKIVDFEQKIDDRIVSVEQKFEDKLIEFKSDFFEKVDPVLKEVTTSREERVITAEQIKRHENRISVIENKLQIKPTLA